MSRREEIGNVYFLKSEESGRIKIGYTAGAPSDELEHFIAGIVFAQGQGIARDAAAEAAARYEQIRKDAAARFAAERARPVLSREEIAKTADELLAKIATKDSDPFPPMPRPFRRPA